MRDVSFNFLSGAADGLVVSMKIMQSIRWYSRFCVLISLLCNEHHLIIVMYFWRHCAFSIISKWKCSFRQVTNSILFIISSSQRWVMGSSRDPPPPCIPYTRRGFSSSTNQGETNCACVPCSLTVVALIVVVSLGTEFWLGRRKWF